MLAATTLDLTVVLDAKPSGTVVEEYQPVVAYEPHQNDLDIGRHYDRLELNWRFPHVTLPGFRGRLTIRPSGTKTTLVLKGSGEPRLGSVDSAEQVTEYDKIARATGRVLLRELKVNLEKEFAILQQQQPSA